MTTHHDPDLRAAVGLLAGEDEPVGDLLPGALAHGRRARRRHRALTAAASVVVLLAGTLVGVAVLDRGGNTGIGPVATTVAGPTAPTGPDAPAGYRWVSAYGVELVVPDTWTQTTPPICQQPAPHTVFVGQLAVASCPAQMSPPPVTSDWIGVLVSPPTFPLNAPDGVPTPISVAGQPGSAVRQPDGTVVMSLSPTALPDRSVQVLLRITDPDVLATMRASVRLTAVDHAGCPTRIAALTPGTPYGQLVADNLTGVRSAALCIYDPQALVLLGGAAVADTELERVVAGLRRTVAEPEDVACALVAYPPGPAPVLHLVHADGTAVDVAVNGCDPVGSSVIAPGGVPAPGLDAIDVAPLVSER